jgi:hypothetical protein
MFLIRATPQDMAGDFLLFTLELVFTSSSDRVGIAWVTFDQTTGTKGSPTRCIFVGVASVGQDNVFVSEDSGATCNVFLCQLPSSD